MTAKLWPFPGDSPVARARKIALAYRQVANELQHELEELRRLVEKIDERAIHWSAGDTVADELQAAKEQRETDRVAELDRRFVDWGETWHAEGSITYQDDDYLDAKEAGKLIQLSPEAINQARLRGRLPGIFDAVSPGARRGTWKYKVADVYKLSVERRPRGWNLNNATDSIRDSGRSDAE